MKQQIKEYKEHASNLAWFLNTAEPEATTQTEIEEFNRICAALQATQQNGLNYHTFFDQWSWITETQEHVTRSALRHLTGALDTSRCVQPKDPQGTSGDPSRPAQKGP